MQKQTQQGRESDILGIIQATSIWQMENKWCQNKPEALPEN